MKILLVSDAHHFSTLDTYEGYKNAFRNLNVNFEVAELHELVDPNKIIHTSYDAAFGLILAKAVNVENEITHVLFVSGLLIPQWLLKTLKVCGKKVGIISLDDPHASKTLVDNKEFIDYWFTNELTLEDTKNNIYYIPTATDSMYPTAKKEELPEEYRHNVVFIGTVYDDRIKPLEDACKYCEDHNLTIGIYGPLLKTPKDSIIRKYAHEGILPNWQTKMMYRGADVVINIDRNVFWNYQEAEGNSHLVGDGKPYSTNPRAYEIALCQSLQLYINPRQEALDIFGNNIHKAGYDDVYSILMNIFMNEKKEDKEKKIKYCFDIVKNNHLYLYRAVELINILNQKEATNG